MYDASTVTGFTGAVRQQYTGTDVGMGGFGMMRPNGMRPEGERPEAPPDGMRPEGERPELPGMRPGSGRPEGMTPPDGPRPDGNGESGPASVQFYMTDKVNAFSGVADETDSASSNTSIMFTDVAESAYYSEAVAWAVKQGITAGTTSSTFSPNATCTSAQIVTFLWRAAGSPAPENSSNPELTVKESSYAYQAALWACEQGIITAGTFLPDSPCTRGTTVYYLWKASKSPAAETDPGFTDVAAGTEYAQAVAWAAANGITSGSTATTFSPDTTCTRGQIAAFLYRTFAE